MGDVNNDKVVNVSDVVMLINYIILNTGDINTEAANMYEDDEINVTDVIMLINYITLNAEEPNE